MKKLLFLVVAGLVAIPFHTQGAQTAQARLFCWSLRFQGAEAVDGIGFEWRLNLSRFTGSINGELSPAFAGGSYFAVTYLYDEFEDETYQGALQLNGPNIGDANGNGFPDFYESSQPVNGVASSGQLNGTSISATWYRDAGTAIGTCVIRLPDPWFPGEYMDFNHSFELIEYTGPLSFTPGSNTVSGSLDVVQTGNTANTFQGPVEFAKAISDPPNVLTIQSLFLTNAFTQTLSLYNAPYDFFRDLALFTNYFGDFEFIDGEPNTGGDDFFAWTLSVDDVNDYDNDTIPDFSDSPQTTLPRRPSLSLARGPTNVLLTISGDINHSYDIQELGSITSTNWSNVLSLTLTNDPQTVSVPLPSTMTKFWRAVVN